MSDEDELKAFDIETTIRGLNDKTIPRGKGAHPKFGKDQKIIMTDIYDGEVHGGATLHELTTGVVAGHNIKFDLTWLLHKSSVFSYEQLEKVSVWDTQVADYLTSGQASKMCSLDKLAKWHGLEGKIDKVKKYWDEGVDTDDIPSGVLQDYLERDTEQTLAIALDQINSCTLDDPTFRNLTFEMMEFVKTLSVIEYNGMHIDKDEVERQAKEAEHGMYTRAQWLHEQYLDMAEKYTDATPEELDVLAEEFNPNSTAHLARCICPHQFEGVEVKTKQQVGTYKNGKPKFKNVPRSLTVLPPLYSFKPIEFDTTAKGNVQLNDRWLKSNNWPVCKHILDYRAYSKDVNTYLPALAAHTASDGLLYGNLNNTLTSTGRLSSSNPNLQNMNSKSDIKKAFTSRFGSDGVIVEADYSQLEVCVLAALTGDIRLICDLKSGVDMHYETGKDVMGWRNPSDMDPKSRRAVKGVNFGIIYGGGAKGLAEQTGLPEPKVKLLISAFYGRYPGVKAWQEEQVRVVRGNECPIGKKDADHYGVNRVTSKGNLTKHSFYTSPTGRDYVFLSQENDWGYEPSISPTQVKNYMVQGTATADIVPIALNKLRKAFVKYHTKGVAYLTNTVHDSIILDVRKDKLEEVCAVVKEVMESVREDLRELFDWEFPVPLNVEIEYGPSWGELTEKYDG